MVDALRTYHKDLPPHRPSLYAIERHLRHVRLVKESKSGSDTISGDPRGPCGIKDPLDDNNGTSSPSTNMD